ncbi:MAG: putative signal peptide protein [Moraxellaceae bacterium]|jgi:anti-sigma factor ChrR (cupin superfamily)|nr:putative signal peptide protein [Moraxellaceae bacterium]
MYATRAVPLSLLTLLLATPPALAQTPADPNAAQTNPSSAAYHTPETLQWSPAPPALPRGAQIAVLMGDPFQSGPFIIRLRMPAGYTIPPHWHSMTENVTVISGTFSLGNGDTVELRSAQQLPAGGFHSITARDHHYAFTRDGAEIQIQGEGPFDITYVNPADNPDPNAAP